jgi:EmrB/QacA subfamily drug resistance transporter
LLALPTKVGSNHRKNAALALIVTAQFMVVLDVAIVNVALPSIKASLGFSEAGLQWVVSAYAIVFGGTLLLGGRLADLLGRRRLFVAGLLLFALSSLLGGFAWSAASIVVFRGLQGLAGALLAPAALSLLMTSFGEGPERNRALGIYSAASGSGAAVGVLLGGVLTSYLGWTWVFFVNVPVGIAAALLAPVLLTESRADLGHRHFDAAGAVTVTAGLMALVYGLSRAPSDGWAAPGTLAAFAAAAAFVATFIAVERRSPWPLLPLRLFRLRLLSTANAALLLVSGALFAEFFLLTIYLQSLLGYSPVRTGLAFSAFAGAVVVASNLARFVVARFGVRSTLLFGLVLGALSLGYVSRLPLHGSYLVDIFPGFVVGGLGLGLSFVPMTISALQGVERSDAGVASGLVNTSRQIGGALGIAIATAVAAASPHGATVASLDHGFSRALYVFTAILGVAAVGVAALLRAPRPAPQAAEEHVTFVLEEAA